MQSSSGTCAGPSCPTPLLFNQDEGTARGKMISVSRPAAHSHHHLVVGVETPAISLHDTDQDRMAAGELAIEIGDLALDDEGAVSAARLPQGSSCRAGPRRRRAPRLDEEHDDDDEQHDDEGAAADVDPAA